jgi:hypothetical protein
MAGLNWKQGSSIYYQQCVEDRRLTVAKYADLINGGWTYVAWFKFGKGPTDCERLNEPRNRDLAVARKAAQEKFDSLELQKAA